MAQDCARCGSTITTDDVRYNYHDPTETDDTVTARSVATYCSVNCIADVEHVDETTARTRLFDTPIEA
jgi:hypothetical protein